MDQMPDFHTYAFWSKVVIQAIILYNTFFHKNVDPKLGTEAIATLEVAYHGVYGFVQSAHALKDGFVQSSNGPTIPPVAPPMVPK